MKILDTNILIRFLINDDIKLGLKARSILKNEKYLMIPESVFPELDYVLRQIYFLSREEVARAIELLFLRPNIMVSGEVVHASQIYKETNLDLVDCIVIACAFTKGKEVLSFDKGIMKYAKENCIV